MIRPHTPFATRYVDYGKVFVPNGALDFSVLAASDVEVARYGPQLFTRGLVFPETSSFARQIGSVSAALLMFEGGYLYTLVQRRREGELSADPRTDRPFNQTRFVLLSREQIEQAFTARTALYSGLALGARSPEARGWLPDYVQDQDAAEWTPTLDRLDPLAPAPEAVRFVTNALIAAAGRAAAETAAADAAAARKAGQALKPQAISVPLPEQDLLEKLKLVEAVQYWVLPRLGVLSWALDYVSVQNVTLRLFRLPPDAPAPLPPERVFEPGPADARFGDDYFAAVSALGHEALYDTALPGLLGGQFAAAEAVDLFRIEKQAAPLAGADALRLYPEMARLGERRLNLLRRVPREDALALLRQADLPRELRLDLLQLAFDAAHGQMVLYAPAHLAGPRAARDEEGVRALLRAALAKSPETSLDVGTPDDQAQLLADLLRARRLPMSGRSQPAAIGTLALAGGTPLLEALFLRRRGAALAEALAEVMPADTELFDEALAIVDRARDLVGLLWLWQHAGQGDFKRYTALLRRVVEPDWYPQLAREGRAWRALLEDGRALALAQRAALPEAESEAAAAQVGALLRALPKDLLPFVWQACLATAEHDAALAEWWLFNEALAMPEQLPAWWAAAQRLPTAALRAAGPQLNFMLGREALAMSLLAACTPPGQAGADEALYATVLGGWLESKFRSEVGPLALATEDVAFLIEHLPESNDIMATVAASATQAPAMQGLTAGEALGWARAASGARRGPYRANGGKDVLFQRLAELPQADEALLWHLLVEDEGSAPDALALNDYLALVERCRGQAATLRLSAGSRLAAFLEVAGGWQNRALTETFAEHQIDVRRVFALLAEPTQRPNPATDLLPLATFHLKEANADLRARAAELLRAGLQLTREAPGAGGEVTPHLAALPDAVLSYLRQQIVAEAPELAPVGRWIDAELSRRTNAYKLEARLKASGARRAPRGAAMPAPIPADGDFPPPTEPAEERAAPAPGRPPINLRPATPPPPPPEAETAAEVNAGEMTPLLGQLALPGSAPPPRGGDSAAWLWMVIVAVAVVMVVVIVGAMVWIRALG
ncbi:MAG: hypothetical protein IT317_02555 [Anaerolineales bacterium]|nr:hypothetical protein [Anaerolineales bacterium]